MAEDRVYVGMRAKDALNFADELSQAALESAGKDGGLEVTLDAERGKNFPIQVVFTNDDMERDEMTGRTIFDWDILNG